MKVAIVGAGICGLYLAQKLSLAGHKVTVFEKRNKIGKEACSGLFSDRILDFFPESKNLIENEIHSIRAHFPKKTIRIVFKRRFLAMNHFLLDNLAADLAKAVGAEIILGREIADLPQGFDRIIGCDGPASRVRKVLGIKDPDFRLAFQVFEKEKDASDFSEVWATRNGFLWKIPRGNEVEYGIIEKPGRSDAIFKNFLKERNIAGLEKKAAAVPSEFGHFLIPKNPSVTLCGDAASLVKPWSGGGVIWGLSAADLLLKNFPDLIKYHRIAKIKFYPRVIFSAMGMKVIYFLGSNLPRLLPGRVKIDGDF